MCIRKDKDGDTILVATHVNDNMVTGSNDDKSDTFELNWQPSIRRFVRDCWN
jgi:hypothetical protein